MSRSRRRGLVITLYASYVGLCVMAGMERGGAPVLGVGIAGLVLFACWVTLVRLTREYGFVGDLRPHTSRDERQTEVRHRSFVQAYWILAALVSAGAVYGTLAMEGWLWLPDPAYRKRILLGLILVCTTLPSAVIVWTEPEEAPETAILQGR